MKIRNPFKRHQPTTATELAQRTPGADGMITISKENYVTDVQEAYNVGYGVGKAEGLATAKRAAIKSLQEIVWQQNKQ